MNKVLLLVGKNNPEFQFSGVNSSTIQKENLYRFEGRGIDKYLRHVSIMSVAALGDWRKYVERYETLIFFDSDMTKETLHSIYRLRKGKRIILYFRNTINDRWEKWNLANLQNKGLEIWSYCKQDCEKYGMKYNKHTLNRARINALLDADETLEQDLFFCGTNKNRGRESILNKLSEEFDNQGISYYYFVSYAPSLRNNHCKHDESMGYSNEIRSIQHSKAVLDVAADFNVTFNSRPIMAAYLKRKLVTNVKSVRESEIYNPSNVFMLGEDDISGLRSFLDSPYQEMNEELVNSYDVNEWIKRFAL